ncbi:hypothetical protein RJT34_13119 [Clitoria ternatea]|uniref:DM2 domain-containing protein n=1 Tax=Clitoria ternatea TaxID=43366 RepID=A0AAN9JQ28_CLITE
MNNQGKNVAASPLFGNFGIAPEPQHPNPMNHPTQHLVSQTQFPGFFQFPDPQSQVLAQAQFEQLQSLAAHAHAHPQTQPLTNLHNVNINAVNCSPSTPATGSSKRASQKLPLRPSGLPSTSQTGPPKTREYSLASGRKKAEFSEKKIPEKVSALLPESALYTQLLDLEARVTDALARIKVDLREAIGCTPHLQKILRIYVFNTFSNVAKMKSENEKDGECSWSLKITGRILEDGVDFVSGSLQRSTPSYPKFSDFFKKITICLDQSLYPNNHVIVWDRACSPIQQDGFEVKRKGNKEFTAKIIIELNYAPDKFLVSSQLSQLIGTQAETRPGIIAALWRYVRSRKLQCSDDPSFFICDLSLQRVFEEEKMDFTMAAEKLSKHLSHPQPIHLEHDIKLSGCCPAVPACYDVQVDVPFPLDKDKAVFLSNLDSQKEIEAYDEVIRASLKKIQEHQRRRAFFLSFGHSPAEFIDFLIASQSKNLKLVTGDASHPEFYNQPWVEDAVIRYLNRKASGNDAPGRN